MITEHQEVARYRVAEQLRAAEDRAQRHDRRVGSKPAAGPRKGLAAALRRMADRLEPMSAPRTVEPVGRHRGTGLSIVR
ncbi:hypothetical protein AB0E69_00125 [Kribbella sp. NPDC026611]|uniref:hypothetical protein n=1 Tax=Kribbella sp. NPDC026611 TaxID=3154911 RepID=UPI0033E77CAA